MKTRQFWREAGRSKTFSAPLPDAEFLSRFSKEAALLDVGCGYGRLLNYLRQQGFKNLYGIDYVAEVLPSSYRVVAARADALPFLSGSFDGVFLVGVLSSILEDEAQERVFREMRRVLRPGGSFFVAAFVLSENPYYLEKYRKGLEEFGVYGMFRSSSGAVFRHIPPERLRELMEGFDIERFELRPFTTMHGHNATGVVAAGRKI